VRPGTAAAAALHAAGSAAALALTLTFALEKGWLTIGLALMAPGIAWVAQKRPLPLLRWLAAAAAVLVLARIAWEPRIAGSSLGTRLIFNWLLYGYGVPALSFWVAGYLLRRRGDDLPVRILEAAAILFTVLLIFFEIRHAMNGGDIYASPGGLAELALQVSAGLAIAIGLEWLRGRTGSIVYDVGAVVVAAVTLAAIVIGLGIAENPLVTDAPVGGPFLNLILLGYGLPAVLAIVLALVARRTRPMAYRAVSPPIPSNTRSPRSGSGSAWRCWSSACCSTPSRPGSRQRPSSCSPSPRCFWSTCPTSPGYGVRFRLSGWDWCWWVSGTYTSVCCSRRGGRPRA
jgi:uncharacterized membrane protein